MWIFRYGSGSSFPLPHLFVYQERKKLAMNLASFCLFIEYLAGCRTDPGYLWCHIDLYRYPAARYHARCHIDL
jgi:hypothetical protein